MVHSIHLSQKSMPTLLCPPLDSHRKRKERVEKREADREGCPGISYLLGGREHIKSVTKHQCHTSTDPQVLSERSSVHYGHGFQANYKVIFISCDAALLPNGIVHRLLEMNLELTSLNNRGLWQVLPRWNP